MKKKYQNEFEVKTPKKYPLERALERLILELIAGIRKVFNFVTARPRDKFEMVIHLGEVLIWSFLTYDIVRGLLGGWR